MSYIDKIQVDGVEYDLEASQVYDDQERVIGTWFGKPLYRKVIVIDKDVVATLSGKSNNIPHNISNIEDVTDYKSRLSNGTENWVFGDKGQTSPYTNVRFISPSNIVIDMPTDTTRWANFNLYITMEYTKTTD